MIGRLVDKIAGAIFAPLFRDVETAMARQLAAWDVCYDYGDEGDDDHNGCGCSLDSYYLD